MSSALKALNDQLVEATRGLHLLNHLSWRSSVQRKFLDGWHKKQPQLPVVSYKTLALDDTRRQLDRIANDARAMKDPIGDFLAETALSYGTIADLIQNAGTPRASELSVEVYGKPGNLLPGSSRTNLDAARYFFDVSDEYLKNRKSNEGEYCLSAQTVAAELRSRIGEVITDDDISVVIDPELASKAAAGATRVRLRDGTSFSENDVDQLLQHEVFVHSLTALNGRKQPTLTALSLGAPRTTAAQEGLATMSELVTGAIDIARMARFAMRVTAIEQALSGADFIEVFRTFLDAGHSDIESFNSTMRTFRGVPLTGGHAFTKDVVYLTGLLEVHTFFRWALVHNKLDLCRYFFAGRMKLSDVLLLEEMFATGVIAPPTYLPRWMVQTHGLTAFLAFAVFADEITVAGVGSDAFNV